MTIAERFWNKVDTSGDCWLWTGHVSEDGYGVFGITGGWTVPAHRASFWLTWEWWPEVTDHLCKTKACVRPEHLDDVTSQQSARRREGGTDTHCKRGHRRTVANTYVTPSGAKRCRTCRNAAWLRWYHKGESKTEGAQVSRPELET